MAGSKGGIEAGRAYVKAYLDDTLVGRGLRRIKSSFRQIAIGAAAGIAAGSLLLARGFGKAMQAIEDTAAIDRVAKAFGLATEEASGLFGVFKLAGATNVRENIESLVTLSQRIKEALSGKGAQAQALFAGLSVTAEQLAALPLDEQFFRLHEAILLLPDPIDRVNRLMLAFGEDGGKTLIGTLSQSTEELRKQAAGLKVSAAEAEKASEAQRTLNAASAAWQKLWVKIASAAAPALQKIAEGFVTLSEQLTSKFSEISESWGGEVAGMSTSWQGFVRDVAAGTAEMEASWSRTQARFARFRLWITDFQDAHPGIFNRDPLGLDPTGQNRDRRRAELERKAREAELRAERLSEQGAIIQSPNPPAEVEMWRGTPIPPDTAKAVNRMLEVAGAAAKAASDFSSSGTFSGRAAGTLGLTTNPVVEKLSEQTDVLKDIERNTEDIGIEFS